MNFIRLSKGINLEQNLIYYFHKYVVWDYAKQFPPSDGRRLASSRVLEFKKGQHKEFGYYRSCIKGNITAFGDEDWIVCSIPDHDQVEPKENNIDNFINYCNLPSNFTFVPSLILRKESEFPKHLPSYGERSIEKDLDNLKLTADVKNKNVLVIDDVTTSGSILGAANQLLKFNGAKKVICLAMAKTADKPLF